MALGTITVNNKGGYKPSAPSPMLDISFPGDGAYGAGGTLLTALLQAKVNDQAVEILGIVDIAGDATYYPVYNKTTGKLMVIVRATGVEYAGGDLSGTTFRVLVLCK